MSAVKVEDCKRNSSLHLAHCLHNLEKELEKAGLSEYSFDLRQKLENSLRESFNEIEMNVSISSSQSQESRVAAAISNPPTPCSPYYVPSSPSYAYSCYSPGNISCSPYYTPSSPLYNPYYPSESIDSSPPTSVSDETPTPTNLSSKSKRVSEDDLDQNTDLKRVKFDTVEDCPTVNEELAKQEDDSGEEEKIEKESEASVGLENPVSEMEEEGECLSEVVFKDVI